jgi:hypothetical protein
LRYSALGDVSCRGAEFHSTLPLMVLIPDTGSSTAIVWR